MAPALFNPEDEKIIAANPIAKVIDCHRDSLPQDNFDQDIDENVMQDFTFFLGALSTTKPARHIRFADSLDNLATRLLRFANALYDQATFPTTLRPHCSSLLGKSASPNASDLDIWTAVTQLVVASDSSKAPSAPRTPQTPQTPSPPPPPPPPPPPKDYSTECERRNAVLVKLCENWTNDYLPDSLEALRQMIRDNESRTDLPKLFYAKTLIFVQSSGMGKSRLADAFGQECPMVNFVLREKESLGYPPADREVLLFMRKGLQSMAAELPRSEEVMKRSRILETEDEIFLESMVTTAWNHSIAVGLLQASFEIFNAWVKQQNSELSLKDLAAIRHGMMAPYRHKPGNCADWNSRSNWRTDFCHSVVSRAEEIANDLIQNQTWRHVFHDDRDFEVQFALERSSSLGSLRGEARKLIKTLKTFPHEDGEPLLVMVFDEASSLLKLDGSGTQVRHALNRIISLLKAFPIWFFFLSTESQARILIPANDVERTVAYPADHSARFAIKDSPSLKRFPPFLGLRLDIEDRRRMRDPGSRAKELSQKMNEFTQPEHMAIFGRPLWFGYDPKQMNELAKLKLVGGGQYTQYNAKDVDHVFAALSFRLSLDVCLQNPRAHSLARTAVADFMRVIISMDPETGVLDTITPSEPVVAKAAMEHLCQDNNWAGSIRTLATELLDKGLIDKGLKGELYSRFILILAHDWLQRKLSPSKPIPQLQAAFTVQQFLIALYGESHRESVLLIPSEIREAWMNFNHFVPTEENLTSDVVPDLLHDLLRRGAALQLAHDQAAYDKLIPIYFGDPDEPFDVSRCGVILIQDKNKNQATIPRVIFGETFTDVHPKHKSPLIANAAKSQNSIRDGPYFGLTEMTHPILFLLFDLGIVRKANATSAPVQVSHTSERKPDIWAIHSRGHDETVFGCLSGMHCGYSCEKFFTSLPAEGNAHYELCKRNKVFSKPPRNFRYGEVHERGVKRKWDSDEDIESRDKNTEFENV